MDFSKGDLEFIAIVLICLVVLWFSVKKIVYGYFGSKNRKGAYCPHCGSYKTNMIKAKLYSNQNWDSYNSSGNLGKVRPLHTWQCNNCGKMFQL
jgi:hypothetical protein